MIDCGKLCLRHCVCQGSCHQGDLPDGGAQCTCVAVTFLCLSSQLFHGAPELSTQSIDEIVKDGTCLHASVSKNKTYMMVSELPQKIFLRGITYNLIRHDALTGLIGTQQHDVSAMTLTLEEAARRAFETSSTIMVVLGPADCAFTVAVYKDGVSIFCFDSHSRTSAGTASPNGKAVLLSIESVDGFISYLKDLAKSLFGVQRYIDMPFELTPVMCTAEMAPGAGLNGESTKKKKSSTGTELLEATEDSANAAKVMRLSKQLDASDAEKLIPTILKPDVFMDWKEKRPWICSKRISSTVVGLTCSSCDSVKDLSRCIQFSKEKLKVSNEWLNGVTADNRKKLHDKVTQHEKSKAHILCCQMVANKSKKTIERSMDISRSVWQQQNADRIEQTCRVFRSVYVVAWKHLPFRVMSHLFELQQQNGIAMGKMLFSHQSCSNIICFIASEMRRRLTSFIISSEAPFSLMFDESTTVANDSVLILYIRALDPEGNVCLLTVIITAHASNVFMGGIWSGRFSG